MNKTTKSQPQVLVVDDNTDLLQSVALLFSSEDIACQTCSSPDQAVDLAKQNDFDVVLLDMNYHRDTTSGKEGLSLIEGLQKASCSAHLVAMTAWASVSVAVEALKLGAKDFIAKPWDNDRLLSIVRNQCELKRSLEKQQRLTNENSFLKERPKQTLIAESSAMQNVMKIIHNVAKSDARLLITGEHGTGKSLLAEYCHDVSLRNSATFVSVNMGAMSEHLFESEMFGHLKGAFTGAISERIGRFELADKGTLFLDEIANLADKHQVALLRLLESGEFERLGSSKTLSADVRLISATNADLHKKVQEGQFREDLLFRINTVPIRIPALRERRDDIQAMAEHFLSIYSEKYNKQGLNLSSTALDALHDYSWPGNVREMDHCMERAVLLCGASSIAENDLGIQKPIEKPSGLMFNQTLDELEKQALASTLERYPRQPDQAANALGISRSALYRKLNKHGLDNGNENK